MNRQIKFVFIIHCGLLWTAAYTSESKNNTNRPSHYGAARQMFGSASLRPKESKTVYAIGRKSYGERSTISPPYYKEYPFIPQFPFRYIPVPEVISGSRSTSRSAMRVNNGIYGGRPEYSNGRPNHGIIRGKYPFDLGLLPGHVYQIPKQLLQPGADRINLSGQRFEHACGSGCRRGEYLCVASCVCIPLQNRCDGLQDCDGNEDELECGEAEILLHRKCEVTKNKFRCPRTQKCILKDWLCDGDDDCGDFSDETRCDPTLNCTSEQFECANGMCIPKNWVCDNDIDCKDFSDELNCTKIGCGIEEFECGDESCITKLWKCDGQIDCSDGSDENDCPIPTLKCLNTEFQCFNQNCIKKIFKCDRDNDCGDWSDEKDCDYLQEKCVEGEFRCNNGKCIPERYRCDKEQDCEDNEDENNCDHSVMKPCTPDEFKCRSGTCILKTWVCDGFRDCSEEEDEVDCEIVCDESKFSCSYSDPLNNKTEFCIEKKHVCDYQKDCPKGEDELACPTKRNCEKNTNCTQLCIRTHDGKSACSCFRGYKLANDGISCLDIDECLYATDPVCSQKCTNTVGSFKCSCLTGYVLRPDMRSCKALGAPPTLLFANKKDILQVSLSSVIYTAILKGLQKAIALDYHYEKKLVFWSDNALDVIRKANLNGSDVGDVIKAGLESPGGLAVDWIHNLIFWTDSGTRRIELATFDGLNRAIVAANDIDKPRAIVVHPGYALVFWTDWGPHPKIERAEMDGRNRRSIITESVFWPNGLAMDYTTNKIYWADAKHKVIESAFFDGSERKKVISKGLPHPFALTIFEDLIYWTDWHTKSISSASKSTGAGLKVIHSQLYYPMDIHSVHPQRQPKFENHCGRNNGGCEHMCIPNNDSYSCMCRFGQKLAANKKNCLKPDKFLIFTRKRDIRIQHLEAEAVHQHDMVIPLEGIKSLSAFTWIASSNQIYWTDLDKKSIIRSFWNGTNQEVIIDTNLEFPAGIAIDWLTEKLYWTDADADTIEVSGLNGEYRSLLIWEGLDEPRDIVVDPISGLMFWVSWGKKAKIEKANMDSTDRTAIIKDGLGHPNSLAIDFSTSLLYWTDSGTKSISCSNYDGSKIKIILEGDSLPHPYGIDVSDDFIYWTDWQNLTIERANKKDGNNRTILKTKVVDVRQVKLFSKKQRNIKKACHNKNGNCSHLCLLKVKGHSCSCPTGIKIEEDLRTCAKGPVNYLLLAHRNVIRQISLDVPYMADVVLPIKPLKMVTTLDVNRKTGEIYWTDKPENVIKKAHPDGSDTKLILMHEIAMPDGIVIDSTGEKIYWTDGARNSIEVAELDGSNRKVLFCKDLDKPRAITLYYHLGLMFWSNWGAKPMIEVAEMDGKHRKVLISDGLQWPNGLATDRPGGRLYWNDGKLHKIESCTLDGQDRKVILHEASHFYGLVVVGNHIYYTDWQTEALHRADKTTGKDKKVIRDKLEGLMDVRAIQSDNIAENVCGKNNGGCSHLCLRNAKGFSCQCPTGLIKNGTTCSTLPSRFLLIAGELYLTRISFDTPEIWEYTLPFKSFENLFALDFHWEKKLIFYTDREINAIKAIDMKDFNAKSENDLTESTNVISTNLQSPYDIAVDWIADNIYWSNVKNNKIEVSRLNGDYRKTIVDQIKDPRSIAVFPRKGLLFWTDWGDSKIEKSLLDGSERKVLFDDHLMFPVGLTIDYKNKRLYWIDAKPGGQKIETSTLNGDNRFILEAQNINSFSLSLYGEYVYWSDWKEKAIYKVNKTSGINKQVIRSNLREAMGITMVTKQRQKGWNPCAVKNGRCKYLCFYLGANYTCGCPDSEPECDKDLKIVVPNKCIPSQFDCDYDNEEPDDVSTFYHPMLSNFDTVSNHPGQVQDKTFYFLSLILMICIIVLCVTFIAVLCVLKGKKNFGYGSGGSFANPNYYSAGNDPSTNAIPNNERCRYMIWKRFKYDRSEERVYADTPGTNSPEAANLIPMILTPCSSNCEVITSDIERSPSATPLHDLTRSPIV